MFINDLHQNHYSRYLNLKIPFSCLLDKIMSLHKFPKIAIITTGYKPVPDISGGAVEHLITQIILENERNPQFYFELYTIPHKQLNLYNFNYTHINLVKNWRKNFFKRSISFVFNHLSAKLHSNWRMNFMANEICKRLPTDISAILMENDMDILRAFKRHEKSFPIIYHMHNDFDTFNEKQKTTVAMKWTVKNVSEIWAVSDYVKNHILSNFPNANVQVLKNCIDRKRFSGFAISDKEKHNFRNRYGISNNDFVILYSGRIIKQKGVLEIIHATSLLPNDIPYKLLIAGDLKSASKSYVHKLKNFAQALGKKVIFAGYISQYEIQTAYSIANLVAIPSQWNEAFCLSALEAITNGKVCIASSAGGLPEVLDSTCAKMIPLGNDYAQSFCNAIIELYENYSLRKKMEENAKIKSETFYDSKQYFEQFSNLANVFLNSQK